jgi:hypothetical protein
MDGAITTINATRNGSFICTPLKDPIAYTLHATSGANNDRLNLIAPRNLICVQPAVGPSCLKTPKMSQNKRRNMQN